MLNTKIILNTCVIDAQKVGARDFLMGSFAGTFQGCWGVEGEGGGERGSVR